jgi:phosphate/sulfate permease
MEVIPLAAKKLDQNGVTEVEFRSLYEATSHSYKLEMREKQNIYKGIIGGSVAAIVGAVFWAFIATIIGYQVGWMAIVVGFLVGYGVKVMGKGIDKVFGVIGAIWALAGCFGGNIFTVAYSLSSRHGIPILSVISQMKFQVLLDIIEKTFSPMDLVFYGLAVYEGFRYSIIYVEFKEKES